MQCECWVVLTPEYSRYVPSSGVRSVTKIKANKIFQKRPTKTQLGPSGVAVHLTFDIDAEAFMPIEPKASIHVPVTINEDIDVDVEPVEINRTGRALKRG